MNDSQDPISTALRELLRNSRRVGLTWQLRTATVTKTATMTDSVNTSATYDGDNVSVGMLSLIGPVAAGQRVAVAFVPPNGSFIIGTISVPPGTYVRHSSSTAATIASNTGALLAIFTLDPLVMQPHSVYRVEFRGRQSCAGNLGPTYFLYKDSVAGTLIYDFGVYHISLANFDLPVFGHCFIANTQGVEKTITLCLAFSGGTGGQPVAFKAGSANKVAWCDVRYEGPYVTGSTGFTEAVAVF